MTTTSALNEFRLESSWLTPWATYMLGLLVGAAINREAVEVATAVFGMAVAWTVGWLARAKPDLSWLAFGVIAVLGLVVGLLT